MHEGSHAAFIKYTVAYFAVAVSNMRKLFLKLAPVANLIKLFMAVSYDFS